MADLPSCTSEPTLVSPGPYCTVAGLNEDNLSQVLPSLQPVDLNYGVVCELLPLIRRIHYPWQLVADHLCQIYQCDTLAANSVRSSFDRAIRKRRTLHNAACRKDNRQPFNEFLESMYCAPGIHTEPDGAAQHQEHDKMTDRISLGPYCDRVNLNADNLLEGLSSPTLVLVNGQGYEILQHVRRTKELYWSSLQEALGLMHIHIDSFALTFIDIQKKRSEIIRSSDENLEAFMLEELVFSPDRKKNPYVLSLTPQRLGCLALACLPLSQLTNRVACVLYHYGQAGMPRSHNDNWRNLKSALCSMLSVEPDAIRGDSVKNSMRNVSRQSSHLKQSQYRNDGRARLVAYMDSPYIPPNVHPKIQQKALLRDHNNVSFKLMELEKEQTRVNKELKKVKRENARLLAMSCGSVCQHDTGSSAHDNDSVSDIHSRNVSSDASDWCSHLLAQINQQRSNDASRCDTALVLDCGLYFHAHSVILAASSSVLCCALTAGNKRNGFRFDYVVNISDVSSTTLLHVLDFLYTGRLHCDFVHLDDVYSLAAKLDIKKLMECVEQLQRKASEQSEYDCIKVGVDTSDNVTSDGNIRGDCTTRNAVISIDFPDGNISTSWQTVSLLPVETEQELHIENENTIKIEDEDKLTIVIEDENTTNCEDGNRIEDLNEHTMEIDDEQHTIKVENENEHIIEDENEHTIEKHTIKVEDEHRIEDENVHTIEKHTIKVEDEHRIEDENVHTIEKHTIKVEDEHRIEDENVHTIEKHTVKVEDEHQIEDENEHTIEIEDECAIRDMDEHSIKVEDQDTIEMNDQLANKDGDGNTEVQAEGQAYTHVSRINITTMRKPKLHVINLPQLKSRHNESQHLIDKHLRQSDKSATDTNITLKKTSKIYQINLITSGSKESQTFCNLPGNQLVPTADYTTCCETTNRNINRDGLEMNCDVSKGWKATGNQLTDHGDVGVTSDVTSDPGGPYGGVTSDVTSDPGGAYGGVDVTYVNELRSTARDEGHIHLNLEDVVTDPDTICDDVEDSKRSISADLHGWPIVTQARDNRHYDDTNKTRITEQTSQRVLRCTATSASGGVERWELSGATENIADSDEESVKETKKRRGPTAYMLWCNENRPLVVAEDPSLDFTGISKRLGQLWQATPPNKKLCWKRKAQRRTKAILKSDRKPTAKPQPKSADAARSGSRAKQQLKSGDTYRSGSSAVQSCSTHHESDQLHEDLDEAPQKSFKERTKLGPSGFELWCRENRAVVDPKNPRMVFFESHKQLAQKWKAIPDKEKLLYKREAKRLRAESITNMISADNKKQEIPATNIITPTKKKEAKTDRYLFENIFSPDKTLPGKNDINMMDHGKKEQGGTAMNVIKEGNKKQEKSDTKKNEMKTYRNLINVGEKKEVDHISQVTKVSELHPNPELAPKQDRCKSTIVSESGSSRESSSMSDEYNQPSGVKLEENSDEESSCEPLDGASQLRLLAESHRIVASHLQKDHKKHKSDNDVVRSGASSWCDVEGSGATNSSEVVCSGASSWCNVNRSGATNSCDVVRSGATSWCCHVMSLLNQQRCSDGKRCDASLTIDSGSTFLTHSAILSLACPKLSDDLSRGRKLETSRFEYCLGDVATSTVSNLLDFLYTGKMSCDIEHLEDTRLLAEKLEVKKLVDDVTNIRMQIQLSRQEDEDEDVTKEKNYSHVEKRNKKSSSERTCNGSVNWCCHLLAMMNQQRFDDSGSCDTILTTTSGTSFAAHSIILAASSPLLNVELPVCDLCESGYASNLGDVAFLTVSNILEFLYTGKLRCDIDSLDDVRILAEKVGVTKLVESVRRLRTQLTSVKHVGADLTHITPTDDTTRTYPLTTHTNHRRQRVRQRTGSIRRAMPQVETEIKTTYERVMTDHNYPLVIAEVDDTITSNTTGNTANVANTSNIENTANAESTSKLAPHKYSKGYYYSCRFCPRKFIKRIKLFEHENRHQKFKAYECSYANCAKAFYTKYSLLIHQGEHTGCMPYQCDKCGLKFMTANSLKRHTLRHIRDENSWTCTICQTNCKSKLNLLNHQQAEHGGEHLPIKCEVCTKSFQLPEQLKRHMKYHINTEHLCSDCGEMFLTKRKLQFHMAQHKLFTCNSCSRVFEGRVSLRSHRKKCVKSHTKKTKIKLTSEYSCPKCNKYFANSDFLEVHLKPDKCHTCSKIISCATHSKIHQKSHSRNKIVSCELCDKKFSSLKFLAMHKQIHNGRNYSCDKCPRAFTCNSHLKLHLKSHIEREYICRLCKSGFWREFDLEIHERTHTGEKPFMCSVCAERFISKRALEGHELMHRPKEHKCETCGKEFRLLKPYQKHINEHENVTKQKAAPKHVDKRENMSGKKRRVNVKSVKNQAKVTGKKRKLDLINDTGTQDINVSEVTPDFEDEHLSVDASISARMDAQQTLGDESYSSEGTVIESDKTKRRVAIETIPQLKDVSETIQTLDHGDDTQPAGYAAFDTSRALTDQL